MEVYVFTECAKMTLQMRFSLHRDFVISFNGLTITCNLRMHSVPIE